jgi:hypothetical protein
MGCERGRVRRLPRGSASARIRLAAGCSEVEAGRTGIGLAAFAGSDGRGGRRDCGQSGPSLNSNCQKTRRKQLRFVNDGGALWMRSCRQRLPRVRSSAHLGNGEIRAKTGEICACASTAARKPAWTWRIDVTVLLKSGASRLEKASRCSGNGAAGDKLSGRSGGRGLFPDARWMVARRSPASLPRDKIAGGKSRSAIVIELS